MNKLIICALILTGCSEVDYWTPMGIGVVATETGRTVEAQNIDMRWQEMWRKWTGRDGYTDYVNGYAHEFTLHLSDNQIPLSGKTLTYGGVYYTSYNMYVAHYKTSCMPIPTFDHEVGHYIAQHYYDETGDPAHDNRRMWQIVKEQRMKNYETCLKEQGVVDEGLKSTLTFLVKLEQEGECHVVLDRK